MKFQANENFPRVAVEALRAAGHDVSWIRTDAPGSPDEVVLARAEAEGRVLLTFDKDFGDLAVRAGLPAECGVILFRIHAHSPEELAALTVVVIAGRTDWPGHFAVIEAGRIRMRRLH